MEILLTLVLIFSAIQSALLVVFLYTLREEKRPTNVKNEPDESSLDAEDRQVDVVLREFDARIASLKEEIALKQAYRGVRTGSVASELHPGVYNLPHDSVNTYRSPEEGEEYAK